MSTRSSAAKQLGSLLVAGTIGAGVGLFFAPHSGQRTRRLIRRKAEHYLDAGADVAEKTEDLYLWAEDTARRVRRKLSVAA